MLYSALYNFNEILFHNQCSCNSIIKLTNYKDLLTLVEESSGIEEIDSLLFRQIDS